MFIDFLKRDFHLLLLFEQELQIDLISLKQ